MILKEYLEILNKEVKENPDLLLKTVIYSSDEEGNSFNKVNVYSDESALTIGYYDGTYNGDFISNNEDLEDDELPLNAVCIN